MRVADPTYLNGMRLFRNGERVVHAKTGKAGKIIKIKIVNPWDDEPVRKYIVYFDRNHVQTCIYTDLKLDVLGELARTR